MLGDIAGVPVCLPPTEWLSAHHRPTQTEALGAWLVREAEHASVVVVSLEMLGYGGLIASRTTADPLDMILSRLAVLRRIKASHPTLTVLGFNLITRISDANSAIEEPAYWAEHGADLYCYSQLRDRQAQGEPVDEPLGALEQRVPANARADFLRRRARNHAVNLAVLQLLAEGVLDQLVLSSDDTGVYGLPSREKRWVAEWAGYLGVHDRLLMYPGADEVGSVLVARAVLAAYDQAPTIEVAYAPADAADHVAPYEDGPVRVTVERQCRAAGLVPVAADGRIWLGVCAPVAARGERHLDPATALTATRRQALAALFATARERIAGGAVVAVADVAYPNGAEPAGFAALKQAVPLDTLHAYGAWNTAGNSLGTVIAQAALATRLSTPAQRQAHERFLVHRLLEDWGYQTVVRDRARAWLWAEHGLHEPTPETLPATLAFITTGLTDRLADLGVLGQRWRVAPGSVRLPWGRLFEIDFDLNAS
jgi:hypothetical protein